MAGQVRKGMDSFPLQSRGRDEIFRKELVQVGIAARGPGLKAHGGYPLMYDIRSELPLQCCAGHKAPRLGFEGNLKP
jgi:hypothetical protein